MIDIFAPKRFNSKFIFYFLSTFESPMISCALTLKNDNKL